MKRILTNNLTILLSAFGAVIAGYLTIKHYLPGAPLPCTMNGHGCEEVLSGPYSHLGPIPTAAFGLGMYLLILYLSLQRRKLLTSVQRSQQPQAAPAAMAEVPVASAVATPGSGSSPLPYMALLPETTPQLPLTPAQSSLLLQYDRAIWALTSLGFLISWGLQYVAIFLQHSFCPYCFTSAVTVTLLAALAWFDYVQKGKPLSGEQKMLGVILAFILVLLGFIYLPGILLLLRAPFTGPVEHSVTLRSILVRPGAHVWGNPKAKYTLVEFADYNCPHCSEAAQKLPSLIKSHPDIRLVFRNFPLGLNTVPHFVYSPLAAQAAEAAALQGKFWPYHDYLFTHQLEMSNPNFSPDEFVDFAKNLGLDPNKFASDMKSPAVVERVRQDYNDGLLAHVNSTPTFFLITPNHIYSFIGVDEFETLLKDPKNEVWR